MPVPAPIVSAGVAEEAEEVMVTGLQNSQRDNMVAAQSARCSKRRKLNVVDVDLIDEHIDSFLPQIVAILQTCLFSLRGYWFFTDLKQRQKIQNIFNKNLLTLFSNQCCNVLQ